MKIVPRLFDSHVLLVADHQEHLREVTGGRRCTADVAGGTVRFGAGSGPGTEVRAELIGTTAERGGSWLWSWAHRPGYPDALTAAARGARRHGELHGVPELTGAKVPLDGQAALVGYRLAVVTCGLAGGYGFHRGEPTAGLGIYLLLDNPALRNPPVHLGRTLTALDAVVDSGQVTDWRQALRSYATQRGLALSQDPDGVELVHRGGQGSIRVDLDRQGRVRRVNGQLSAAGRG